MFVVFPITLGPVAAGGESRSAVTDGSVSVVGGSGMMLGMPALVRPAIVSGSLSQSVQPSIPAGRAAVLRPWTAGDAADVVEAFHDPAIQRWHVRRADSISEAAEWIDRWRSAWTTESKCHWAVADLATSVAEVCAPFPLWLCASGHFMTPGFTASNLSIQQVTRHPVALPPDSTPKVRVAARRCMLTDGTTCTSTPA
jgi:hypothetical protein